jgi:hypothetical protein
MRLALVAATLILVLFATCLYGQTETPKKETTIEEPKKAQKLVVTGTLSRAMAIGAETTGWSIQLDSETTIDGKPVHSVEIAYPKADTLEKLNNQRVKAKGKISHQQGVETGQRTVLAVSSIKEIKKK